MHTNTLHYYIYFNAAGFCLFIILQVYFECLCVGAGVLLLFINFTLVIICMCNVCMYLHCSYSRSLTLKYLSSAIRHRNAILNM